MPSPVVLHLLSQRPGWTGSGTTLHALVRHAAQAGWQQHVVVGLPAGEPVPELDALPRECVHPLFFGAGQLDFPLPGMSDVMPYPSTRFASMNGAQWEHYRAAWRAHVERAVGDCAPALIHSHHVWTLSALVKDVTSAPQLVHGHATGLRQLELCPDRADDVRRGVRRAELFAALHAADAARMQAALDVASERVRVVGAGYREELFHAERAADRSEDVLYVGKLSRAKGLPWLLDAFERLAARRPRARLHLAGSGAGDEAEALKARAAALPRVFLHGQLAPEALAQRMRRCAVCVLPSMHEGLPLVLVEAAASGCRLVATALPGVTTELAPHLGSRLRTVTPPRCTGPDEPWPADLPAFVDRLEAELEASLDDPPPPDAVLERFTWRAVFERVERLWRELLAERREA